MDETDGDWREEFGMLSADEAESLRSAAIDSREGAAAGLADRQQRAVDRFETVAGGIGPGSGGRDGTDDADGEDDE